MSNIITRSGGSNGTTQACAACKYQRRKCAPDCILAPYFPHDRQRQFLNAHKLFGVSNITKIIKNLNPPEKDIAMRTIMYQSDARANDPVGGCFKIIQDLQRQIDYSQAELDLVYHQLAICRSAAHQAHHHHHHLTQIQEPAGVDNSTLGGGCDLVNAAAAAAVAVAADPLNFYYVQEPQDQQFAVNDHNHHDQLIQENYDSWGIQESTALMSSLNVKQGCFIKESHDDHDHDNINGIEVKPDLDQVPYDHHDQIKFEADELVERRFVPSTQLVMSS